MNMIRAIILDANILIIIYLQRHFDRPIPELDSLRARLRGLSN